MSKERITVLVAANMTGSEKRKLLVIGKSQHPRCFKNVKSLPVSYENNNPKAWMTSVIFEKSLRNWDNELKIKNKKILLLVDNFPAHPNVMNLKHIKLVFLPPNTTSVLQPMDQSVIISLKVYFRKLLILQIIEYIEKKLETNISILDAIIMLTKAWEKVTVATMKNCFEHADSLLPVSPSESMKTIFLWLS